LHCFFCALTCRGNGPPTAAAAKTIVKRPSAAIARTDPLEASSRNLHWSGDTGHASNPCCGCADTNGQPSCNALSKAWMFKKDKCPGKTKQKEG
jgi:hypothetical protein